jgi:putative glycosyltransferase
LVGGLIIAILGIIGVYLAKVFSETKRRPCFIVRELYSPRTSQTLTKKEYHD